MKKDIKQQLIDEKNKNIEKIDKLDKKIDILRVNTLGNKITLSFALSTFAYVPIAFSMMEITLSKVIPLELIPSLSLIVPTAIGVTAETLINKKDKIKEKLEIFSKAKTEKEKFEEQTKYKIEKEKLESYNKIIDKTLERITADEALINSLSDNYKIAEKEDNRTKEEIEKDIKGTQQLLEEKHKEIDTLATQKTLKDTFWKVRSKVERFDHVITNTAFGFMILFFLYNMASIMTIQAGATLPGGLLGLFAPGIIGGVTGASYGIKKQKDETKAFRNINKSLGENALDDFTNNTELKMKIENNNIERFDLELEQVINDTAAIKLQLEKDKQKITETSKMSDGKEVMDNFMKKLQKNELSHEKEPELGEDVVIDDKFIGSELEQYDKLLNSPVVEAVTGKSLVKKKGTPKK